MPKNSHKTLEYDKLKNLLTKYAVSELGCELIDEMKPLIDKHEIQRLLSLCSEAKELYQRLKGLPLDGLKDIRSILRQSPKPGSVLDSLQFLDLANFVRVARKVKRVISENKELCPDIWNTVLNLSTFPSLAEMIDSCIGEEGKILDTASRELRKIRRQKESTRENIRSKLKSIMRSSQYKRAIQDDVIMNRNERYVIPVRKDRKETISGVVQGESNSGATIFMEPKSVVRLNNKLHELVSEEKHEIRRILLSLTDDVREYLDEFYDAVDILAEMDFLTAKAKLSIAFRCSEPVLNSDGYIDLIEARHPLLELTIKEREYKSENSAPQNESLLPDKIVPIDFQLGVKSNDQDGRFTFNTLVITGPNTGGKTVALKTVGLLTLMAQSGLHIPAIDGSEIGIFDHIFADVGDEQSIEQNLSTFSSHIKKIIAILDNASPDSLVLLDEIGAGTDPSEGTAIGMAVVDYLQSIGAKTVVTTHHGALKAYAHSKERMENASVEFDWHTLSPTYRLKIGVPGSSNALKIAKQLGLSDNIIQAAKEYIGGNAIAVEDLIASMEESRRELENERQVVQEKIRAATDAKAEHESLVEEVKGRKQELSRRAEQEALRIVENARKKIENTIEQIRKEQASKESIKKAHQTVDELEKELKSRKEKKASKELANKIKVGDNVEVKSLGRFGEIIFPPEKGEVEVQVGTAPEVRSRRYTSSTSANEAGTSNMRITVSLSDIELTESEFNRAELSPSVTELQHLKKSSVKNEIHIRGQRVAEAMPKVDKYIDDVFLAGLSKVRIIHGKGTGTLKRAVRNFLDDHPHVIEYKTAALNKGGAGVTVVSLEQ